MGLAVFVVLILIFAVLLCSIPSTSRPPRNQQRYSRWWEEKPVEDNEETRAKRLKLEQVDADISIASMKLANMESELRILSLDFPHIPGTSYIPELNINIRERRDKERYAKDLTAAISKQQSKIKKLQQESDRIYRELGN
jgi:hypothetical protein